MNRIVLVFAFSAAAVSLANCGDTVNKRAATGGVAGAVVAGPVGAVVGGTYGALTK